MRRRLDNIFGLQPERGRHSSSSQGGNEIAEDEVLVPKPTGISRPVRSARNRTPDCKFRPTFSTFPNAMDSNPGWIFYARLRFRARVPTAAFLCARPRCVVTATCCVVTERPCRRCTTAGRSTAPTRRSAAGGSSPYAGSSIAITDIARVRYKRAHCVVISDFCTPVQYSAV